MDGRERRIAENEALFRDVNERIERVTESMGVAETAQFLCECGSDACTAPLTLALPEYEAVRTHPTRFAVVPGHEIPDVERVVERTERFAVIEKFRAEAARIARDTDPRTT